MRALVLVGLVAVGCGDTDPCEVLGDQSTSAGGLRVTAAEHGPGWGQAECATCHQVWNIHQEPCVDRVDLVEVRARADLEDPTTCVGCHGSNGVDWLEPDTGS